MRGWGTKRQDKHDAHCNVTATAYFPSSSYSWYSSVNLVEVAVVAIVGGVRKEPEPWGTTAAGSRAGVREDGSLASNTGVPFWQQARLKRREASRDRKGGAGVRRRSDGDNCVRVCVVKEWNPRENRRMWHETRVHS